MTSINQKLSNNRTKKPDRVVVLMHDIMFRTLTGGKDQLTQIISELKKASHTFNFILNF